jgi:hypothetical protein
MNDIEKKRVSDQMSANYETVVLKASVTVTRDDIQKGLIESVKAEAARKLAELLRPDFAFSKLPDGSSELTASVVVLERKKALK